MADPWALFGDDDDATWQPSEPTSGAGGTEPMGGRAAVDPRASTHPYFAAAAPAWRGRASVTWEPRERRGWSGSSSELHGGSSSNLPGVDLARRVPPCASALRARGHEEVAAALERMMTMSTARRGADGAEEMTSAMDGAAASETIARAVEALARLEAQDGQASAALNGALLLARGVKAELAASAAAGGRGGEGEGGTDGELAMAGAEAAVLLAELATMVGADTAAGDHRWVGDIVARAAAAAAAGRGRGSESGTGRGKRAKSDGEGGGRRGGEKRGAAGEEEEEEEAAAASLLPVALAPELCAASGGGRGAVPKRDAAGLRAPEFYNAYLARAAPVLISGLMARQRWSALERFRDLSWLKREHGEACVPVEIGRRHADGTKGESRYMLLGEFIDEYLDIPSKDTAEVAYMSQHSLLHQSPGLQECFSVPEHTMGRLAAANAWLGTAGTVRIARAHRRERLMRGTLRKRCDAAPCPTRVTPPFALNRR